MKCCLDSGEDNILCFTSKYYFDVVLLIISLPGLLCNTTYYLLKHKSNNINLIYKQLRKNHKNL